MKYINSVIVILVVLLVFGNTVFNGYNLDDELVSRNNELTTQSNENSFVQLFTSAYYQVGDFSYGYRPITLASFYVEHKLFGESATVSHLINLILYTLLVLLIHKLLIGIFRESNSFLLLFITLLFAILPIHSEVVASIKNRDEILCLLFFISAAIVAIKWISSKNNFFLLLTLLFASFSILAKKSAIPLLFIYPLLFFLKENLSLGNFLKLSICFSIPLALFAFNFQWFSGILVLIAFYVVHLSIYGIQIFLKNKETKPLNTFEIISTLLAFLFLVIGAFFHDLPFFLIGFLLVNILLNKYLNYSLILNIVVSTWGFFVFYQTNFLTFSIILLSIMTLKGREKLKFNPLVLFPLLALVSLVAHEKNSLFSFLIYVIPLSVFYTSFIHRFLPLIISIISLAVVWITSTLNFFYVGIFFGALIVSQMNSSMKWTKILITLFIVTSCGVITNKQYVNNGSVFGSPELLGQIETNDEFKTSILKEGRKLEFMENTLIVPHSLNERLATGVIVLNEYLRLMVFPKELSFYYGYSKIDTTSFQDIRVWFGLLIHIVLLVFGVYFLKKEPLISIGILCYLASILFFSNLPVLVAGMVGERLAFTASLGFCIAIGGIINWIKPNFNLRKPKALEVTLLALLVVFAGRTIARNQKWESHVVLMSNDIEHLEASAQANYLLAVHLVKDAIEKGEPMDTSQLQKAIYHFIKAIEIYPDNYNFQSDLGRAHIVLGNRKAAKQALMEANRLEPRDLFSLEEIAKISFELKQYNEAIRYCRLYWKEDVSNPAVYELAAFSSYYMDDYELALIFVEEGLVRFPNNNTLKELLVDLQRRTP